MTDRKSALAAFVLAACAALSAAATWFIGVVEAGEVAASCGNQYALFADLMDCRWPAYCAAIGWVLFTGAIAAAWVGGVRLARARGKAPVPADRERRALPPRNAHPTG
jgi:hypothetical protein